MRKFMWPALAAAAALAVCAAFYASRLPDGLEKVVADLGIERPAENKAAYRSPITYYRFPGVKSGSWGTVFLSVVGVGAAVSVAYALGRLFSRREPK